MKCKHIRGLLLLLLLLWIHWCCTL